MIQAAVCGDPVRVTRITGSIRKGGVGRNSKDARMSSTRQKYPISVLAAMLVSALYLGAALPTAAQTPTPASDKDGAFGIIVNRPIGERPLAGLLEMLGEKETAVAGTVRIFAGGPVQPEMGFVIHSRDYHRPGTTAINEGVAMTASREILRDIGHNNGPKQSLIAFGYAGWGPGQLEGELARRDWSIAPGEPKLIFDEERENVWDSAFAQRMQDL